MDKIKVIGKLTNEERETVLVYNNADKVWHVDSTITKHANKFKKQGWKQIAEYTYEDGTPCGGAFEGPARAITFRSTEKKQMSEAQMGNLFGEEDDED